jgi:UDP-2,4-diacetamido-2,4,6-trideoxy-beta-L-altropyranose hydrolase
MHVAFRTDASSAIGLGHLRRCISLAQALRECGASVQFALRRADVDALRMLADEGFEGHWLEAADDAEAFNAWAQGGGRPAWVVVDHYGLDAAWHRTVRDRLGCAVAVIDDLADRALSADALIDHNFVAAPGHRAKYGGLLDDLPVRWLCGPRYALLGAAYRDRPPFVVEPDVRSIGIFLGGTDPQGLSSVALQACRRVAGFSGPIEIVSTSANRGLGALRAAVDADGAARLSVDLPDLADFYARHDLQIGAGGGATWERCAVGVPALTLCIADNQMAVIPALAALGALATCADNGCETIGRALAELLASQGRRAELARNSQALIDGLGARRAALALLAQEPAAMTLRPAQARDAEMLWQWRNHPATRAASRHSGEISLDSHKAWLERTLGRDDVLMQIAHCGAVAVGVIRFQRLEAAHQFEVSLNLDPGLHGLGLGARMLGLGHAELQRRDPRAVVNAEVLPGNAASRQLFLSAGYTPVSDNVFAYHLNPASPGDHP